MLKRAWRVHVIYRQLSRRHRVCVTIRISHHFELFLAHGFRCFTSSSLVLRRSLAETEGVGIGAACARRAVNELHGRTVGGDLRLGGIRVGVALSIVVALGAIGWLWNDGSEPAGTAGTEDV